MGKKLKKDFKERQRAVSYTHLEMAKNSLSKNKVKNKQKEQSL